MNPYQELLLAFALSQRDQPIPFITDDPLVNHAIYCHEIDEHTPFNRTDWEDKLNDWENSGGMILGWIKS